MARTQVEAFLATTDRIPAYGGFELSEEMLRGLANDLREGGASMLAHHDERFAIDAEILEVDVRRTASGSLGLWTRIEVDEEAWQNAAGAARAMSVSLRGWVVERVAAPAVQLSADAGHFSDDDIEAAAAAIGAVAPADWSRLYQFSEVPPAKVVLEFAVLTLTQVPIGVLANAVYDGLRRLLRPRMARKSIFVFRVAGDDGKVLSARLETQDEGVLRHAIDRLLDHVAERPIRRGELLSFDEEHGDWE